MRAVFLDRDGVINQAVVRDGKPFAPENLEQVVIPEGTRAAMAALSAAGFLLIGITNQPDVARGAQRKEMVEAINQHLIKQLPLGGIYVCYHDNEDNCECRKPRPGLIFQAAAEHGVDVTQSYMIGDRGKDIEAGLNAGCETIFIDFNYQEITSTAQPDKVVRSFPEAVTWILERNVGK